MKHIRILTLSLLAAMLVLGLGHTAFARDGEDDGDQTSETTTVEQQDQEDSSDSTTRHRGERAKIESENKNDETETEDSNDDKGNHETERLHVENRREELKKEFESLREHRKEALKGTRLEVCQKREEAINALLSQSVENSKKKLAVFQSIESGVKEFYVKKNLTSDQYAAAVANADQKAATAIAAIDAMGSQKFDCSAADGAKPNGVIKLMVQTRNNALKEYRTAVKNLILVVKKAIETAATTSEGDAS